MKLFVIAALVAVAAAGRLEHLERSYLPPQGSNSGVSLFSSQGTFGASSRAFGAARSGLQSYNAGGNFAGATSNQYLPPNHGTSANIGASQFSGSLQGFGGQQNFRSQQYSGNQGGVSQQYLPPRSQFSSRQAGSSFGSPSYQQFGQQSAAASRQYLAPHASSRQQAPQQAFNEQTGYQY
ncbi:hypothetical protein PYW07_005567 [Mythimna separata]|uniref:Uncharacterized protein n=1 Tax=Mythimna separata TaxID=271217 RepID=A0AAD7YIB3_MYTSE|nr:hypothetical protein PYW07_005567 [Mythimna separata]